MKILSTVFLFFLVSTTVTIGQVDVTTASGGTDLDRSISSANGDPGGYATLGNIVITEMTSSDIKQTQTNVQLILTTPFNWQLNTTQGNVNTTGGDDISAISITVATSTITITFSTHNGNEGKNSTDQITISGIQVQATDGNIAPATGNILRTRATPGNADIDGIANGATNFGTLSLDLSTALPVELTSFSAKIFAKSVNLEWTTAAEVNNYGFEILRSTQDDKWDVLGFVEGHGNSNSPKEYNFTDSKVNSAGTYSYRLKQIDNDGTYEFSNTIEVNFGLPISLELSQNYPNPFNPSTTISFSLPESGNVALKVFNSIGQEVVTLADGFIEAGVYTFNFNAEGLPSGMYIYRLSTPEKTQARKMILMK